MKYITLVLALFAVAVQGQPGRPPRPPPPTGGPPRPPPTRLRSASTVGVPVQPAAIPTNKPTQQQTAIASVSVPAVSVPASAQPPVVASPPVAAPKRPEGCSPGCGPTEICAKLGDNYCRRGQICSVCIKMESIRFPASALAGMFQAQQTVVAPPVQLPMVPTQQQTPIVQAQQAGLNPFSYLPTPTTPSPDPFDFFGMGSASSPMNNNQNAFSNSFDFFGTGNAGVGTGNANHYDFFGAGGNQGGMSNTHHYDIFSSGGSQSSQTNAGNSNYMPFLFFEGFGLGGLGF